MILDKIKHSNRMNNKTYTVLVGNNCKVIDIEL